jgi:hypothetical protein
MKAIEKFAELEHGILGIIKAADLYALHTMAQLRNTEPDSQSINFIMNGTKISGFNVVGSAYTKEELSVLKDKGYFTEIGQQIIVASHTALEIYLILKFKEYYRHAFSDSDRKLIEESLNQFNFRSLKDFKELYKNFFSIHLPSFEIDYHSSHGCNFQPKNSWEALKLIYGSRNNIVHKGSSVNYQVSSLMDSWYPFEFVRSWVNLFDTNFDLLIYKKTETRLYSEHKQRAINCGVSI